MQLIFDNLIATFILGAIALMIITVNARNQSVRVEATGAYALRSQQVNFISTLRRDMAGVICDESNVSATCPDIQVDPGDYTYTFHTRLGGSSSTVRKVIYKREKVGELDGTDLYQIKRYVDPSVSLSDPDGGSMSTITSWSVRALNEDGNMPTKKGDIRRIKIRFETISPFTEEAAQSQPWEATYRPMYLREDKTL